MASPSTVSQDSASGEQAQQSNGTQTDIGLLFSGPIPEPDRAVWSDFAKDHAIPVLKDPKAARPGTRQMYLVAMAANPDWRTAPARIRATPGRADPPEANPPEAEPVILLLAQWPLLRLLDMARACGYAGVLFKPYGPAQMSAVLQHFRAAPTAQAPESTSSQTDGPDAPASTGGKLLENPDRSAKSVLVVDDNAVNRTVVTAMAEQLGGRCTQAVNGSEAVTCCQTQTFDLILMDIHMPILGGIEATGLIRGQSSLNAQTPIVGVTADALPSTAGQARDAGMTAVITKPLRLDRLEQALRGALVAPNTESPVMQGATPLPQDNTKE